MPKHTYPVSPLVQPSMSFSQLSFQSKDYPPEEQAMNISLSKRRKGGKPRLRRSSIISTLERATSPRKQKPSLLHKDSSKNDDMSDDDEDDDEKFILKRKKASQSSKRTHGRQRSAPRISSNAFHSNDDDDDSSSDEESTDDEERTLLRTNMYRNQRPASDKGGALETPYAQAFDAGRNKHGRRPAEPLRAGDIISYYHPAFVAGNPMGLRVAQVLKITNHESMPLVLSNMECLSSDCYISRVREYHNGKLVPHHGLLKAIEDFKYTPGDELPEEKYIFEDRLTTMQRILQEGRNAVEQGPLSSDTGNTSSSDCSSERSEEEREAKRSPTQRVKSIASKPAGHHSVSRSPQSKSTLQTSKAKRDSTSKRNTTSSVFLSDSECSADVLQTVVLKNLKRSSSQQHAKASEPSDSLPKKKNAIYSQMVPLKTSVTANAPTARRTKDKIRKAETKSTEQSDREDGITVRRKHVKSKTRIIDDTDEDSNDVLDSGISFRRQKPSSGRRKPDTEDNDNERLCTPSISSRMSTKNRGTSSVLSTATVVKEAQRKLSMQEFVESPSDAELDPKQQKEQQRRGFQSLVASSTNGTKKRKKGKRFKIEKKLKSPTSKDGTTWRPSQVTPASPPVPRKAKKSQSPESASSSSSSLIQSIEEKSETANLCDHSAFDRQAEKPRKRRRHDGNSTSPLVQSTNRVRDSLALVGQRPIIDHSQESINTFASDRSRNHRRLQQKCHKAHKKSSLELQFSNAHHPRY